jgi:hypothetical protein
MAAAKPAVFNPNIDILPGYRRRKRNAVMRGI